MTAIGFVIGTVFLLSLSDIVTEHLTMKHPVELVVAIRYLASLLLLFAFAWPQVGILFGEQFGPAGLLVAE